MLKNFLEHIGICPERVQFSWVSASEGARFAALVDKVAEDIKRIGPAKIPMVAVK
jgi:coenzyme F420-reducing hydrogenase delta subunit